MEAKNKAHTHMYIFVYLYMYVCNPECGPMTQQSLIIIAFAEDLSLIAIKVVSLTTTSNSSFMESDTLFWHQ